jgi:hypothetical protein
MSGGHYSLKNEVDGPFPAEMLYSMAAGVLGMVLFVILTPKAKKTNTPDACSGDKKEADANRGPPKSTWRPPEEIEHEKRLAEVDPAEAAAEIRKAADEDVELDDATARALVVAKRATGENRAKLLEKARLREEELRKMMSPGDWKHFQDLKRQLRDPDLEVDRFTMWMLCFVTFCGLLAVAIFLFFAWASYKGHDHMVNDVLAAGKSVVSRVKFVGSEIASGRRVEFAQALFGGGGAPAVPGGGGSGAVHTIGDEL